jgi:plasmid stabilization system protein ParE
MTDLIFLLNAEVDIQTAFNQFEHQQEGRGVLFMQHLDAAFTHLRHQPQMGPPYKTPYRRLLVSKFPYGVFYEAQATRIIIAAIVDLRQSPRAIHRRLFGTES